MKREMPNSIAENRIPYEFRRREDADRDLSKLIAKVKDIYSNGSFDERARLHGTVDLLFQDIKKQERDSGEDAGIEPEAHRLPKVRDPRHHI